ncbi:HD-GYP domain-containing protein [Pectinatus cerevisiiphilus]|uniref:Putative nucleotidyltransferase with HDIG domain n=1 Tax=Pectinatus cerevisiiphilus TaxID=86956 RepID=A0A4R3K514_9FIRM|nr:HD-GYP domain-containing protein [Pectinatus cerevisiiphilus]TCS77805.1 putative nucleotidyltransferase with HDIG domain [Pectinatus cerevisiiphilus]
MIILPVARLRPGMTICQSVFDDKGLFLLRRGTKLSSFYIFKLKRAGIKEIAVASTNAYANYPLSEDIVCETTRIAAIKNLSNTIDHLEKKGILLLDKLQSSISAIIREVTSNKQALVQLNDIRMYDSYTLVHSVNVSILSALIGSLLNLTHEEMEDLTLGAILHDIGKIAIPIELLNKKTPLTQDEFIFMKKHPVFSVQKLHEGGCFNANIIDIAGQHHEKIDGTGYPYGLRGNQIHLFAKIAAIADVYDALTSVRPYKKAYKPHISFTIMTSHSKGQFDTNLLQKFFDHVALYPNGTILKTNRGIAIVKESFLGKVLTPIIYIFADGNNVLFKTPILVDMSQDNSCTIESVYDDYEILSLVQAIHFDPASLLSDTEE